MSPWSARTRRIAERGCGLVAGVADTEGQRVAAARASWTTTVATIAACCRPLSSLQRFLVIAHPLAGPAGSAAEGDHVQQPQAVQDGGHGHAEQQDDRGCQQRPVPVDQQAGPDQGSGLPGGSGRAAGAADPGAGGHEAA
jgi:hypothetical protein